jgi:predicted MFS family arabinose efflux permease
LPEKQVYLLPPAKELAQLSNETAAASLQVLDNAHRREHSYATLAMICGTIGFLACIGTFAFLVVESHPQAGAVVLGTGVLTIIGQIINSRLNRHR